VDNPAKQIRATVTVAVLSQDDLCAALYALYLASEREDCSAETNAKLNRVMDALGDITNHTGIDAIASDAMARYFKVAS
jgi:hypothetical protein